MRKFDFSQDDKGESLAEQFRAMHRLAAPLLDLTAVAEQVYNADIAYMALPDFLDAITARDNTSGTTLIAIATSDNPERQRFSLAHEIGHLAAGDLHIDSATNTDESELATELRAHAFARHLLLPRVELEDFIKTRTPQSLTLRTLSDIVEHFRVSGIVAVIQLHRIGRIDDAIMEEWRDVEASHLAVRYGWAEEWNLRMHDAQTAKPPKRMVANATDAYLQHLLPAEGVAAIEGVAVEKLLEQFESAGVRPTIPEMDTSLDDV